MINVVERGEGIPLVLLHGFAVDHRMMLPLDPTIADAGDWRRIYLDLPGHGHTPVGDVASSEDVVEVVSAEIRRRVGTERFAVLGYSFGGMIARRIAHDFGTQVLGLATIAAVFVPARADRDVPPKTVLIEDPDVLRDLGDAAERYAEYAVVQTPENAALFLEYADPGLLIADQDAMALIAQRYALDVEPEDAAPGPFTRPTLIVTGRQDHVVGYRDAWARLEHYPRAEFVVLDSAGHNTHLDRPDATATLVTDWLRQARCVTTAGASFCAY